jgi:hypothetical protein
VYCLGNYEKEIPSGGYVKKYDYIYTPEIEDLNNKKAIIMLSIEKYKSKEIDKFIKSMDKYMLN